MSSPSQVDLMSMDSLSKLTQSVNEKEKEETFKMDNLIRKLDHLKKRKQRRLDDGTHQIILQGRTGQQGQ